MNVLPFTPPPDGGERFGHPSDLFLYNGTAGSNALAPAPDGWGGESGEDGVSIDVQELGDGGQDGGDIPLEGITLVKPLGLLSPAVQLAAEYDPSSESDPEARIAVRVVAIDEDTLVIAVELQGYLTDYVPAALSHGTPTFETVATAGDLLQFEGHLQLAGVHFSPRGFRFRVAEAIALVDPATGDLVSGDEFQFELTRTDGAAARVSGIDIQGADLGSFRIPRPGRGTPEVFRRGDTDGNRRVEMSDAVRSLAFLFLNGPEPTCFDAADSNDSGAFDLSDAINTLNVLFLGVGSIPAPGSTMCGADPTADELSCTSYATCE